MNKVTKAFAMTFAFAIGLMLSALVIGCSQMNEPTASNEPANMIAANSEATADMTATALGNQSAGLAMMLGDSYQLATSGTINSADGKSNSIGSLNASYDSTTGWHTITVTKNITWGNSSITSDFVYQFQYIDTAGKFQQKWNKHAINIMNFKFAGVRDRERGTRVDIDDTASGNWTISGLANYSANPLFTGSYSRSGADTLLTKNNTMRSLAHSLQVTFANDTLIRLFPNNDKIFFLSGTANSTFHAADNKGNTIDRSVVITYEGNGFATLNVTRTKDGVTSTYTVDVYNGIFVR